MALEEAAHAFLLVDALHGVYDAEPARGVFCELWVGCLEEDFDAVEGSDDGFGLEWSAHSAHLHLSGLENEDKTYRTPRETTGQSAPHQIVQTPLIHLLFGSGRSRPGTSDGLHTRHLRHHGWSMF
jgi:hypothetical protein